MLTNGTSTTELQEFMLVLRRALLMIVHYIEKRYGPEIR